MLLPNKAEFMIKIESGKVVRFSFENDFLAGISYEFLYRQPNELRSYPSNQSAPYVRRRENKDEPTPNPRHSSRVESIAI